MKREIKFRGFSIEHNTWVYGFCYRVQNDNSTYSYFIIEDTTLHQRNVRQCIFEVVSESIVEFTGLKYKNGVDIYEGDIMDYGAGRFFYVAFENGAFVAKFSAGNSNSIIPIHGFAIVGNIYQNPELLK